MCFYSFAAIIIVHYQISNYSGQSLKMSSHVIRISSRFSLPTPSRWTNNEAKETEPMDRRPANKTDNGKEAEKGLIRTTRGPVEPKLAASLDETDCRKWE